MQLMTQISWPVIIAGCVGGSAAITANMISLIMIGKINEKLPESERMSYVGWGTDVRKRFKELYPGNKLTFFLDSCMVLMALSFAFLAIFWAR
jgi:hypothetical protein